MSGTATTERTRTGAAPPADRRGSLARWAADLLMGVRFAVTGGREGWVRTILTAVGVGLGVALLLGAASVPEMMASRDIRNSARSNLGGEDLKPGPETLRVGQADTEFRDEPILGLLVRPDGDNPPVPPGLGELPGPGEMVVSPALAGFLKAPGNELLRERLDDRITGTIGDRGLSGPDEMIYYAGGTAEDFAGGRGYRIDHFGSPSVVDPLSPELLLLVVVACVVLLLPVAIFVATAVRFGGERRDRRLAALRLVGADGRMTRRIAAGEAMFGALVGLLVGGALFLALRRFADDVTLAGVSLFPHDIRPSAGLAALIAVAVPVSAVAVTLLALRGVAIEPLGVVRNTVPRRRRLWWRLLLPVLGVAVLAPMIGDFAGGTSTSNTGTYVVALGTVLLLVGITALLPWLVETVVGRFSGGPLPWQLATRRLQLSSGTAARAVSGITVAVAGAIAIQMLFASVEETNTRDTGQDTGRFQMQADTTIGSAAEAREFFGRFRTSEGSRSVASVVGASITEPEGKSPDPGFDSITVGDCASLRELASVGENCEDGDVFVTEVREDHGFAVPGGTVELAVGETGEPAEDSDPWTVPESARIVQPRTHPAGLDPSGVLATPSAVDVERLSGPMATVMIQLDPGEPDAVEHVRNTAAEISPLVDVYTLTSTSESEQFTTIRRGLFFAATATLLLIGASLVVSTLEQLRERRRLLSVLVAFGTRRTTLAWSVLWQTAVPVVLGLALAVAGGLGLGVLLLKMVGTPLAVDWGNLAAMAGIGGGVILLVTALSLPPLWRMMRPEGLRTE
ncbi:FtsX-like permease family protein [Streptomyces lycii]|nr:FtsX-like permease family protein [Streptomyces lycii]